MTKTKKITLTTAIIIACAITALFIVLLCLPKKRAQSFTVAFYDLTDKQETAILEALQKASPDAKISSVSLSNEEALLKALPKKTDIVFTRMGKNADSLCEGKFKNYSFPSADLSNYISSMRGKAVTDSNRNIIQLPILLDSYEIDINTKLLKTVKIEEPTTWKDLEEFAKSIKEAFVSIPITFAGKDSDSFLTLLGALTESYNGSESVLKAYKIIQDSIEQNEDTSQTIKKLCESPEAPMYAATHILSRWLREGLITREVFNFTKEDLDGFMTTKQTGIVFMTLTEHREQDIDSTTRALYETLPGANKQKSPFFPAFKTLSGRALTAPVICAVAVSKNSAALNATEALTQNIYQEAMSRSTGLAPLSANAKTPDRQSDDARFWVAASSVPLTPLPDAVFTTQKEKQLWAELFKEYILKL